MADPTLDEIIPLLLQQKKMQDIEGQRKAAATYLGGYVAPNLTDYLTQSRPTSGPYQQPLSGTSGPPAPITAGKIPSEPPIDPRLVGAARDAGVLGVGGLLGRAAGALGEGAAGLAGKVAAPSLDSSGALRAIGGAAALAPPDTAQAARLSPEQRQQLEFERRKAAADAAAEQSRIQGQTQAGIEADKARAEAQRQLEAHKQQDMAAALKKEREMPFREAHPDWAKALPILGVAGATGLPPIARAIQKIPLNRFVYQWEKARPVADKALEWKGSMTSTVAI